MDNLKREYVYTRKKDGITVFAFLHVVGFTSQRALVHFQVIALDYYAIGWQEVALKETQKSGQTIWKKH